MLKVSLYKTETNGDGLSKLVSLKDILVERFPNLVSSNNLIPAGQFFTNG